MADLVGYVRPNGYDPGGYHSAVERYTYDADDRLVRVSDCTGAVLEYRYDGNNRRIYEKRRISGTADREGCGKGSVSVKEDRIRYIRTSVLLSSDAESARTYYHYASDEMSSITHVVDGENEEILNRYEYDA